MAPGRLCFVVEQFFEVELLTWSGFLLATGAHLDRCTNGFRSLVVGIITVDVDVTSQTCLGADHRETVHGLFDLLGAGSLKYAHLWNQ
jgi:hypothetical protein